MTHAKSTRAPWISESIIQRDQLKVNATTRIQQIQVTTSKLACNITRSKPKVCIALKVQNRSLNICDHREECMCLKHEKNTLRKDKNNRGRTGLNEQWKLVTISDHARSASEGGVSNPHTGQNIQNLH